MFQSQKHSKKNFRKERYANGQLALFLDDEDGEPLEEFSIMQDSVKLARDEIILKDYSETLKLTKDLGRSGIIIQTDRFVLINSHVCPICKVLI
ncbi:MAG: hypothetical protein ACFFBP_00590 [Promethearchaeota archaeon]